jgi:hypothetical protein
VLISGSRKARSSSSTATTTAQAASAVRLGGVSVSGVLVGVHAGQQRGPQDLVEDADRGPGWVYAGSGRVGHRSVLLTREVIMVGPRRPLAIVRPQCAIAAIGRFRGDCFAHSVVAAFLVSRCTIAGNGPLWRRWDL